MEQLEYDPQSFVGQSIYKDWGPQYGVCHGRVIKFLDPRVLKQLDETRWTILYDDNEQEDFDTGEMKKYCIQKSDGKEVTLPSHQIRRPRCLPVGARLEKLAVIQTQTFINKTKTTVCGIPSN